MGGGSSDGKGTLISSERRQRRAGTQRCRDNERHGRCRWRGTEAQGGGQGSLGNGQAWGWRCQRLRYTDDHRLYCSYMQRHQDRDTRNLPATHTQHFTRPALAHSQRGGTARCQVAGLILPAPQGWDTLPAPSACLALAPAPRPPTCCLETGWQMAPRGLRWQQQGSILSGATAEGHRGRGRWGAAHLVGRNPNLPEAVGNGPGPGERRRLPGRPWALHATTGLSQPRLEAKAHRERAGTNCCGSDEPLGCRRCLATRYVSFSTACPSSPAKVHGDHRVMDWKSRPR